MTQFYDSLVHHPLWPELVPFIKIQYCPQDARAKAAGKKPRFRIEFKPMKLELTDRALRIRVACPACKKPYDPIRMRRAKARRPEAEALAGHIYYASGHRLLDNPGCSKGHAASAEYERIEQAVKDYQASQEPPR